MKSAPAGDQLTDARDGNVYVPITFKSSNVIRSSPERWNAIQAAIVNIGYSLGRSNHA